jgi:hypothetical protein
MFLAPVFRFIEERVNVVCRQSTMNIVRVILAVLTIVLLIVSVTSNLDPHDVQFAILPLAGLFVAIAASVPFEEDENGFAELTSAPRLLTTRAPPLS